MEMEINFSASLVHGKARPRFARMGKGVRAYTAKESTDAERAILCAYRGACIRKFGHVPMAPAHVPVSVTIATARPLPKSRPRRVISEPDTYKPDIDNVIKTVLDALNGAAWSDDAQVTYVCAVKCDRQRGAGEKTCVVVRWEDESVEG